jgi:NAD(P)-dependent dehydrogenase (short-subunit alcohol dehydrogenase family)
MRERSPPGSRDTRPACSAWRTAYTGKPRAEFERRNLANGGPRAWDALRKRGQLRVCLAAEEDDGHLESEHTVENGGPWMKGKVVVITGSTRGFGFAIAKAMLRAEATVVISGRSDRALKRASRDLRKLGTVVALPCDVRRERQVYALARSVARRFGRIDVWINNAGYSAVAGMMMDIRPEEALNMFLANDLGTLYGTRAALHFMMERNSGTLVNVYGAGSFLRPASPTGLYGATKAWITSFTRTLAKEMSGTGLHVIGFSPGMLLTDMLQKPTVAGERGRQMMKNYGLVLRLLAGSPDRAAEKLMRAVQSTHKPFVEYRLFKSWTPLLGLMRIGWENLMRTTTMPPFRLKFIPAYRPKI